MDLGWWELSKDVLCPFVYGDAKRFAHQTVMSEKGPKFSLYATQALCKDADGTPVPSITGVHRSGSGNCFMTHTTCPELGPYKWAYVVRSISMRPQQSTMFDGPFTRLENTCILWTSTQRTVDWHALRLFRATSTSCVSIFCSIAKSALQQHPNFSYILEFFGIRHANFHLLQNIDIEMEEVDDLSHETDASLMLRTKDNLREMCQIRNLKVSGNKADLTLRLLQFHGNVLAGNIDESEEIADPLVVGIMSSWMMKPKSTTSMKVGALNERNILPRIRQFWNAHFPLISVEPGESYDWIDHREYGLMGNRQHPLIATSVDAMGLVQYVWQGQMFETFCTVEVKTATTQNTSKSRDDCMK